MADVRSQTDGRERTLSYRFIRFDDQSGQGRVSRNVAYLFHVNGQYKSSPLEVRRSLQNLLERYGYYAKVELMTITRTGDVSDRSLAAMNDFLSAALPEVERCLPDWDRLHAKPAAANQAK